jgi:hypothetical protein
MGMETAGFIIGASARGTSRIGYRLVACSDTPPWLSCAVEEGRIPSATPASLDPVSKLQPLVSDMFS